MRPALKRQLMVLLSLVTMEGLVEYLIRRLKWLDGNEVGLWMLL